MKRYRLAQIKTETGTDRDELPRLAAKKLGIDESDISGWQLRRMSVDSRKKPYIQLVYTAEFDSRKRLDTKKHRDLTIVDEEAEAAAVRPPREGRGQLGSRPVVIGAGPCGLFAALELAKAGYRPLLLERGPAMDERAEAVDRFKRERVLDPEANMLFGEGGAGTFSDGKLATGIRDGLIRQVLSEFAEAGAGEEIMYLAKPHIGTDVLRTVIVNIRKKIISLGGEVRFKTKAERILTENGRLTGLELTGPDGCGGDARSCTIDAEALILAPGHSARDSFAMLKEEGAAMEQKPFSIGVRMEHPQSLIDAAQYGEENLAICTDAVRASKEPGRLPPADYRLSYKASNGRGVYSFCMCPGGEVVVCSTGEGELCVNGMSHRRRDSGTANSGILCDVRTEDFGSDDVLAGVHFQEKYEMLAFKNGGGDFTPPSCSMKEFLGELYYTERYDSDNDPYEGADLSTDNAGVARQRAVLDSLPDFAAEAIREAVPAFSRKIHAYDSPDAVVTAVETRSSSPVRILRDASGESNIRGLYPAGEGAGYAGGISSAACDGIRAAWHIIEKYRPPLESV